MTKQPEVQAYPFTELTEVELRHNKVKDQVQTAIVVPITPEFVKCKSCGTTKVIYDLVEIEQRFWDEYSDFVDKMYDVLGEGVIIKEGGKND